MVSFVLNSAKYWRLAVVNKIMGKHLPLSRLFFCILIPHLLKHFDKNNKYNCVIYKNYLSIQWSPFLDSVIRMTFRSCLHLIQPRLREFQSFVPLIEYHRILPIPERNFYGFWNLDKNSFLNTQNTDLRATFGMYIATDFLEKILSCVQCSVHSNEVRLN